MSLFQASLGCDFNGIAWQKHFEMAIVKRYDFFYRKCTTERTAQVDYKDRISEPQIYANIFSLSRVRL